MNLKTKKKYYKMKELFGLGKIVLLDDEEQKIFSAMPDDELPTDIFPQGEYGNYFRYCKNDFSEEEEKNYLELLKCNKLYEIAHYQRTIKNCAVYFTTLSVISLIIMLFIAF